MRDERSGMRDERLEMNDNEVGELLKIDHPPSIIRCPSSFITDPSEHRVLCGLCGSIPSVFAPRRLCVKSRIQFGLVTCSLSLRLARRLAMARSKS